MAKRSRNGGQKVAENNVSRATAFLPPLRVLIFGKPDFRQQSDFVDAIRRSFNGASEEFGYLAAGADLGVDVRWFPNTPATSAERQLAGALHTLCIVLANPQLSDDRSYTEWLDSALSIVQESNRRHRMIILSESEATVEDFVDARSKLVTAQFLPVSSLGEQATRPAFLGLMILNEVTRLLAKDTSPFPARQQLFISHAKKDGLPLAQALLNQLDNLPRFTAFYDARSLMMADDWERDLEKGIESSVVIVLRTDEYDRRPFCVQELRWADEYGCPTIVVEASNRTARPRSDLPLSDSTQVFLRDGNLLRVIYAAMREGLRAVLLKRHAASLSELGLLNERCVVLDRMPGVSSVRKACSELKQSQLKEPKLSRTLRHGIILYPEPILSSDMLEAMNALADHFLRGTRLMTLAQFLTNRYD